ncbi:hypothetical protein B0H66DRAFT_545851 [Apodospora peruviana]|uniref:Uncharacterized protein n=1 Tax=Apodospora peruviana TaxID=516989 RepID=A0AAE0MGR7_9PEZI|nr:hypothetical protein B0H66DRAFT_545851 [Apodospora peruviana]
MRLFSRLVGLISRFDAFCDACTPAWTVQVAKVSRWVRSRSVAFNLRGLLHQFALCFALCDSPLPGFGLRLASVVSSGAMAGQDSLALGLAGIGADGKAVLAETVQLPNKTPQSCGWKPRGRSFFF